MEDDEVQVVEVTVRDSTCRTVSPKKKRKREEVPDKAVLTPRSDENILQRAAQLKRRLEFCEKEREELSKRFKELREQLTEQQQCELDVKLETSEKHIPIICVGDGEEDDDVVFILPEDYSPRKRQKIDNERKSEKFDTTADNQPKKDLAITYFKPATNLPHAREHCAAYKFVQSNVTTATVSCNENFCEQCYCYVCDAPVKECDSWKTGTNPHCNAYSKNAFWEKLRKTAKRKTSAVQDSLLKCLPSDEQTESMVAAAAKAAELLETLKDKLNDSSSNFSSRPSSPSCDCDCHYDSCGDSVDGEGCDGCYDYHEDSYGYGSNCNMFGGWGRYDRFNFDLSGNVSIAVSKAKEYLADNQPGPAALVLDALTVVLLPADSERWFSHEVTSAIKSLRKAWIEVLMHPELPKNVEDKVRERLKNAINGAMICSPESSGLNVILEMKKWTNELLVKCFAGQLGNNFIKEDEDVAEARLALLEKNKRFSDALSYLLSCKVTQKNRNFSYYHGVSVTATDQRLTNMNQYRRKFVLLLAKTGKTNQALNVLTLPVSTEITKDVMTNTFLKDSRGNVPFSQCTLGSIDYSSAKELLTVFVTDNSSTETGKLLSPSDIPEETCKRALSFILTGTQVNSNLRFEQAMEWYINTLCVTSLTNDCSDEKRKLAVKEAEALVTKAKQQFLSTSEIKPPKDVSFKVFVVELFAALVANLYVNNNCYPYFPITNTLEIFKRKSLLWGALSVVLSPVMCTKISGQILNFVLVNIMKPLGSRCIPIQVYTSWVNKLNDINGIEKNYEIALCILKEGQRKSGQDGLSLRKDAVLLVKNLTDAADALLNKAGNWSGKDKLSAVLKKIKKDFGKEVSKHGLKDFEGQLMSLCFKNDPSYANFKDVKKVYSLTDKWPSLKSSMIDFLKKHRTSHTGCCIEVFAKCGMFKEVKATLSAVGYTGSHPSICEKMKAVMFKLNKDEACQFVDACSDWLAKTLCDTAFALWRCKYSSLHESLVSCVRAIATIKTKTLIDILSGAMQNVSKLFCDRTVQLRQRTDLERWLRDIKGLFGKQELTEWSWAFHELTTGPLKRKGAVIKQLRNSASLMAGTLSYNQLLAVQAKEVANSTPSGKQAQGSASKTTGSGTQASTATAAVPKQPVATPVSKPNSRTSAPRVAGSSSTSSSSTIVNKTASNFYGRSGCIPATNQSVSPAVSTPNMISTQRVPVNLLVNTLSSAASPQVASRTLTSTATKLVSIAPKSTNAPAVNLPTSTTQAVPGSSSAPTAVSLVTSACKGAGKPS